MNTYETPAVEALIKKINETNLLTTRAMMHEISNVVTLINSSLQMIAKSHPEVCDFKYWNSTMEDLQYLCGLLADISQFNTCDHLSMSMTDVPALLRDVITSFESQNPHIAFTFKAEQALPEILCDRTRLRQVFINLIKNACEALEDTPDAQITISISDNSDIGINAAIDSDTDTKKSNTTGTCLVITITDNGCGIEPENLSTIFTPMVSYKQGGSGLGLPISKKIIEAHKGSLYAKSSLHKGTCFTVTIPVTAS